MKKYLDKKEIIMVIIMLVVQIAFISVLFWGIRQGRHGDELWSYGYSNAHYLGQLYEDEQGNDRNMEQWIGNDVFWNYLTVQPGERFDFGSVAYNIKGDKTTVPLYYDTIHFVSSLFPGKFSWAYGFFINLVLYIGTMLAVYLITKEICGEKWFAVITSLYCGFSVGVSSCYIFIRPYAMLTCFATWIIYFHFLLYKRNFEKALPLYILVTLFTFGAGFSQYYGLVMCFFMAAFTDFYLLLRKKWKSILAYSASVLLGVGVIFALWQHGVGRAADAGELYTGLQMNYTSELQMALDGFLGRTIGLFVKLYSWRTISLVLIWIAVAMAVIAAICFLMRNEQWFIQGKKVVLSKGSSIGHKILAALKTSNKMIFIMWAMVIGTLLVIAKVSAFYLMRGFSERYVFCIMPAFIALFMTLLLRIAKSIFQNKAGMIKGSLIAIMCVAMISAYAHYEGAFLMENSMDMRTMFANSTVVGVLDHKSLMINLAEYLLDAKDIYMVDLDRVMDIDFSDPSIDREMDDFYVVIIARDTILVDENDPRQEYVREMYGEEMASAFLPFTEVDLMKKFAIEFSSLQGFEYVGRTPYYTVYHGICK